MTRRPNVQRSRHSRARGRWWVATLALALTRSAPVEAQLPCTIRPPPANAESAWANAWRDVSHQLEGASASSACAVIELTVRDGHAALVLTTRDGKRGVREVSAPFELQPTAEAMLVTFNPPVVSRDDPPAQPSPTIAAQDAGPPQKPTTLLSRILLGGSAGARVGGGLATPVIDVSASLVSSAWEFGIVGQWEVAYASLAKDNSPPWSGSGVAAGIAVGRRQPLWSQIEIVGGVTLQGVVLHQEMHHKKPEQWMMRADGRIGAYAGAVVPRGSPVRIRMDFGLDRLLSGSQPPPASPDLPSLPSWGATVALGVEANGP